MSTSYTSIIVNSESVTFKEFLLRCARAVGPFTSQRNDPADTPPARRVEALPEHFTELEEARKKYRAALTMTEQDWDDKRIATLQAVRTKAEAHAARVEEPIRRYRAMLERCKDWEPPTGDHEDLKSFMISQINSSIGSEDSSEHYEYQIDEAELAFSMSIAEYRKQRLSLLRRDISYHQTRWNEEQARTASSNAWIDAFWENVDAIDADGNYLPDSAETNIAATEETTPQKG